MVDAAPLIGAQSMGLFIDEGLDVRLRPVQSWARMRDLLKQGEIDAAHMLAPMVIASALGLEKGTDFTTAFALNLGAMRSHCLARFTKVSTLSSARRQRINSKP